MVDVYFKHMEDHSITERMDKTWGNRPKSKIVKSLMEVGHLNGRAVAEKLGVSVQYFNNKLHRNSWSFEDLIQVADACGYSFVLMPTDAAHMVMLDQRVDVYEDGYKDGYNQAKAEMLKKIKEME